MKLINQLFSGWLMGSLLILFAGVIGRATFIENDFGAKAARMAVYEAWWFEFILFLMVVNFTGMIFTKKLYLKGKWNVLIIHLALIIIIIGAGVTRYFGEEGQMHIREGKTSNVFRSSDTYLQVHFKQAEEEFRVEEKIALVHVNNEDLFAQTYDVNNKPVSVVVSDYYPNSELTLVPSDEGDAYLSLVLGGPGGRQEVFIREGETKILNNFGVSFGDTSGKYVVQIIRNGEDLFIRVPGPKVPKAEGEEEVVDVIPGFKPIVKMSVQTVGSISFVVKELIPHGKMQYQRSDNPDHGVPVVKVLINDQEVMIADSKDHELTVNDIEVSVRIGTIPIELPFALKLNKFDLERYPGSNSPSSFASEVTLIDEVNNIEMPYRIYMNNILNYGGYRFFQSSYDQDEKGTILSVNNDYWGTFISYFGYFLLFASLIALFFTANTRFSRISYQLKEVHEKRKNLTASVVLIAALLGGSSSYAQVDAVTPEHAAKFGKLFVQNKEGRIEPVNTIANKVLVKIHKKNTYKGLSADQVFLGIMTNQVVWQDEPIIIVRNEEIQDVLGIKAGYAAFSDFLNAEGQYKLMSYIEKANVNKPAARSTFDKDVINLDERVNVFYMALNGSILKIFPLENDPNNRWAVPQEFHQIKGHGNENAELYDDYIISLREAIEETNDFQKADKNIEEIANFQRAIGGDIVPSETTLKLEIFYNKANIFKSLFPFYLVIGMILAALFFLQTFRPKFEFKIVTKILLWLLILGFIIQTIGLGIRWYISGHAPWSNGYESMIYISWATVLAGFIFMKKSYITLGVTAILAGITLLTAHMNWLNPELTNLVPVLKSYWLTIHVATITASYGFLALGCLVGFLNLCTMIFRNEKNSERVNLTLRELSLIIEMSLTVGLILLIIGNFLGGIWANESWGRYWGWDPKETWTLVTIVLYSFTLHLSLIPSIRNAFTFNFMAAVSFGAVLMTYFGVNYYLSGLHSYAGGDPVSIPSFVYYSLGVFGLVSLLAGYNEFSLNKGSEPVI